MRKIKGAGSFWAAVMISALLGVTGCGNDDGQLVGSQGATLSSADGRFKLEIPAGALSQPTRVSLQELADAELPATALPGTGIAFSATEVDLLKPATLTLRYDAAAKGVAAEDWLRVVKVGPSGALKATRLLAQNSEQGVISVALTQLSRYALADLAQSDSVVQVDKQPVTDVDVLFVVDNSNSMQEEQQNLAQNFPRFIQQLEQAGLNYRVGVISSDLGAGPYNNIASCEVPGGDGGKLQHSQREAGCLLPNDPWIEHIDGVTNVPGDDVASAFSCIAQLGASGCGFEQPLEAAKRALDPQLQINPGFLRDKAALVVVLITDEDDCSAQDTSLFDPSQIGDPLGQLTSFRCFEQGVTCAEPSRQLGLHTDCTATDGGYLTRLADYQSFFRSLKPQGAVLLSAIAGNRGPIEVEMENDLASLQPSCASANGQASPPVRLATLVDAFGPRGKLTSICDGDLGPALAQLGSLVVEQTQLSWCLPYAPQDTDPTTAAIEGDCEVTGSDAGKILPCSADSSQPCYSLEPSQSCAGSGALIQIKNLAPDELGDTAWAICLVDQTP